MNHLHLLRLAVAACAFALVPVAASPAVAGDDPPKSCPRKNARPANPYGSVLIPTVVEAREVRPADERDRAQDADADPSKEEVEPSSEKASPEPEGGVS